MTLPYILRPLTPADADTIQAQRDAMFLDMGRDAQAVQAASAPALAWLRPALAHGEYEGVLAHQGGVVVAGAGVLWQSLPPSPATLADVRAYLLNVYVHPEHRGHGLARTMLQALLDLCRQRGVDAVSLHASDAGRPTYDRLGFGPTAEAMHLTLPPTGGGA